LATGNEFGTQFPRAVRRITEHPDRLVLAGNQVHANRGVLTVKTAAEETRTYTARNIDQKAKTLIVEHPLRQGYTLLNQKPAEKTPVSYRFEIALAPGATQEFAVNEERVFDQTYAVTSLTPDVLLSYIQNRTLTAAARQQFQAIAGQKQKLAAADREIQQIEQQMRDLSADEDRIRRNIQSLNAVSGQQQQVQTYARQLDQAEQQLATLRDRQAARAKEKAAVQGELDRLIEGLSF